MKLQTSGRLVKPALGLAWSNCINTRIFLSRAPDELYQGGAQSTLRCMQIVQSPSLPSSYCYFTVSGSGLKGLKDHTESKVTGNSTTTSNHAMPLNSHRMPLERLVMAWINDHAMSLAQNGAARKWDIDIDQGCIKRFKSELSWLLNWATCIIVAATVTLNFYVSSIKECVSMPCASW